LRTITALTNIGVYYDAGNQLEVTSPSNNRIDVDTGAWLCDGQHGYNDTAIGAAGNIVSPAANPRIDRVIVRKNFTGNTYNPGFASAAFDVPPLTARITVIHGVEAGAPVAPTLIQDTNRNPAGVFGTAGTWDIPLAQYEISVGGIITNLTDEREYVDAEIKRGMAQCTAAWNTTDGTAIIADVVRDGIQFPDNKLCFGTVQFALPNDFIKSLTVTPVYFPLANGNVYNELDIAYGACNAAHASHTATAAYAATAVTSLQRSCIRETSCPLAAIGDMFTVTARRDGTDVLDTVGDFVGLIGVLYEYLGWR
jgi:hypothetical protein